MKTLVLANQKGGVGKSAIGTQLAFYASSLKLRVLYIDLDHQQNSSRPLLLSCLATRAPFVASALQSLSAPPRLDGQFVVIPGDELLSNLERMPDTHNAFANNLARLLAMNADNFDLCVIDTNPTPDIRYGVALVVADYVVSPIQLNQEALDGISQLLMHHRYGMHKIKQAINNKLELIGLLPNAVEATPFQRTNLVQLAEKYADLLIELAPGTKRYAFVPKRTAIAEAQAEGSPLFNMKKTAARDAWVEIKPIFDAILNRMQLGRTGYDT